MPIPSTDASFTFFSKTWCNRLKSDQFYEEHTVYLDDKKVGLQKLHIDSQKTRSINNCKLNDLWEELWKLKKYIYKG